jgi:hypothetical protein
LKRFVLIAAVAAALAACKGPESAVPSVQFSADAPAKVTVSLNRIISGQYRTIAPICVGQRYRITLPSGDTPGAVERASGLPVRPGETAEFRNYLPDVPANVTALAAPAPMYSPNLVAPYNTLTEAGETFSYWRYTFPVKGAYEFFDTNMGEPGRRIVDSYYGTVTFVGESNAPKGVVCVDAPGCSTDFSCLGAGASPDCCSCIGVCCDTDDQCGSGMACLRNRCVDPATIEN